MNSHRSTMLDVFIAAAVFVAALPLSGAAQAPPTGVAAADNDELARLYTDDQSDRMPADGKPIDWKIVGPRDKTREARIKELYTSSKLQTGADYYHAAMILQHAAAPEDCLLAHELCVTALIKGEERAGWLAAASEDRYLMKIGRPQRFGTQYRSDGPGTPLTLYQMDSVSVVTNQLRSEFDVPSPLAASEERSPDKEYVLLSTFSDDQARYAGEIDRAMSDVDSFFHGHGLDMTIAELIDTVIILDWTAETRQRLADKFGVRSEDIPETFSGTVIESSLYIVSAVRYREIWERIYSEWPWTESTYRGLIVHELAHKAHEQIAIEQTGSADGMGPDWFFEGLAVMCAGQFDDGVPEMAREEVYELVGPGKTPVVSYPLYGRIVRFLAANFDLKELMLRASQNEFPYDLENQ